MTTPNPSQTQQAAQDMWKKLIDDQLARAASLTEEVTRLQARGLEQARGAIDEIARLGKDSLGYLAELGAEWRKLALDATRRTVDMFTPRA